MAIIESLVLDFVDPVMRQRQRQFLLMAYLAAMVLCNIVLGVTVIPKLRKGYQDFTIFYTGARMLRSGQASVLYNLPAQYKMQQTFTDVPIRLGPLPFNHPPYEAVFFIPFTLIPYWPAYLVWSALNLLMLGAVVILLGRNFAPLAAMRAPTMALAAVAFFPIAIGLIQGQDIVLLLLLFVLAMIALDKGDDGLAGVFLGLGLFRPQTVVPLALFFAIRRRRLLLGFIPVGLLYLAITVAILGWSGPLDYARFVIHLEGTPSRAFGPEAVPNLRGLVSQLPGLNSTGPWAHLLIIIASVAVVFLTARRIWKGNDSWLFTACLATAATILVGFHSLVYDFTLMFPMVLFFMQRTLGTNGEKVDTASMPLVGLLCLTPLYALLLLVVDQFFWFSLVLLYLYFRLLLTPAPAEVPA